MAFVIPSLSELVRLVENKMSVSFYGSSGSLRVNVLKVLSRVFAGAAYPIYLLMANLKKNRCIKTEDVEFLIGDGADFSLPHKPAGFAHGKLAFHGTSGTPIPVGTVFEKNGGRYVTITAGTVGGTTANYVECVAEKPGAEFNVEPYASLDLADGVQIVGLESAYAPEGLGGGILVSVVVDGQEQEWGETVEAYRERLLYRRNNPLSGSSAPDYKTAAMRFSFVTDCEVFSNWPTTNAVSIYVLDWNSVNPKLNTTELNELRSYMQNTVRRSICANVMVGSPDVVNCSATIALSDTSEQTKRAVIDALNNLLRTAWPGSTVSISDLQAAIKSSVAVKDVTISALKMNGVGPIDEQTFVRGGSASGITGSVGLFDYDSCIWETI